MYDTRLARRWNLDPVDQIYFSNYSVFRNNPVLFEDENGDDPIYAKRLFGGSIKKIGDDGKNDGKSYFVRGSAKRDVLKSTKSGNEFYNGNLTYSNKVFEIPTGGILDDVKISVKNTESTGLEHGGHYMVGDQNAILWDPGTVPELVDRDGKMFAKASIYPFKVGGENIRPRKMGLVAYWWHVHPKVSMRTPGGTIIKLGSSTPSDADFSVQSGYEIAAGYTKPTFVIGTRDQKVTFFNGKSILFRIKYSDFIRMGERQ